MHLSVPLLPPSLPPLSLLLPTCPPAPQVVEAYLKALFSQEQYQQAADLCPGLLLDQAPLWERWVYMFAQARQLPLLAARLPTREPQLRSMAYDLALTSLLHSAAHHALLLQLVHEWPAVLYSRDDIIQQVGVRVCLWNERSPQRLCPSWQNDQLTSRHAHNTGGCNSYKHMSCLAAARR